MKKLFSFVGIFVITILFSQNNETYIKANALFLPIGIVNVGVEHGFSKHVTGQFDVLVSPWKSFAGTPMLFGISTLEGRYYFDEAFKHWFVGVTVGFGVFNVRKWNYWKSDFYVTKEGEIQDFRFNETYQKGFSYMVGISAGYQWKINEKWNMEIFGAIGNQQGFYKGYVKGRPENQENRYDKVANWDKSGEMIPFKGGIMFSYKL